VTRTVSLSDLSGSWLYPALTQAPSSVHEAIALNRTEFMVLLIKNHPKGVEVIPASHKCTSCGAFLASIWLQCYLGNMKIRLKKDLDYVDYYALNTTSTPQSPPLGMPPKEQPTAGNQVHKKKGDVLEVQADADSEAAEPTQSSKWFILVETGNRFRIASTDFESA
jgi:hypothetical protein